jgi:hypothetical protein
MTTERDEAAKKLVKGSKEAETLQVYDYVDFICVV